MTTLVMQGMSSALSFLSGGLSPWKMYYHHNIANTTHPAVSYTKLHANIHITAFKIPPLFKNMWNSFSIFSQRTHQLHYG